MGATTTTTTRRAPRALAVLGTATALAVGAATAAPIASAADPIPVTVDTITAGPLLALLAGLGINSVGPLTVSAGGIDAAITLDLTNTAPEAVDLANANDTIPQFGNTLLGGAKQRGVLDLGIGTATPDLVEAYRGMIQGVSTGNWPAGFTAWTPTATKCSQTLQGGCATTFLTLGLARDLFRPNGGLLTRFSWLSSLLGIDTSIPAAGTVQNGDSNSTSTLELDTSVLDMTWEYDPLADFPETLNPFSLVNSVMATLPLNILTGISNFDQTLGVLAEAALPTAAGSALGVKLPNGTFYSTIQTFGLPIMELFRLPVQLLNAVTGWTLPTPIANILEPAMKILVNVGYSDVLTPDELNNCAQDCTNADLTKHKTWAELGYQAYDRALTQGSTDPTSKTAVQGQTQNAQPFGTVAPLTLQQWLDVPGAVVNALFDGLNHAFDAPQPLVPASTAAVPPASAVSASRIAATPAAAAESAPAAPAHKARTGTVRPSVGKGSPPAATPKRAAATRG